MFISVLPSGIRFTFGLKVRRTARSALYRIIYLCNLRNPLFRFLPPPGKPLSLMSLPPRWRKARACPELAVESGVTPSTSLPVTANATPKRSLPIHIPEKDTPLPNCCQRKTRALFKPFSELLPKHRPIPGLIPSQTPPHLHIIPSP